MRWRLDDGQIEVMDDAVAETMRRKTPAERVQIACEMHRTARLLIEASVRRDHPDSTDDQAHREAVRRLTRGAI